MTSTSAVETSAGTDTSTVTIQNNLAEDLQLRPYGSPYFAGTEGTAYKILEKESPGFDRKKGALLANKSMKIEVYVKSLSYLLVDFRPFSAGSDWRENQAAHMHFDYSGGKGVLYDFTYQYQSPIASKLMVGGKEIPSGSRHTLDLTKPQTVSYTIGKREDKPKPDKKIIAVSYGHVSTWQSSWSNKKGKEVQGKITTWRFTLQPEEFDIKNWQLDFDIPKGAFIEQSPAEETEKEIDKGVHVTLKSKVGEILLKGKTRDIDVQVYYTQDLGNANDPATIKNLIGLGWM
ncbi:hypothetical protein [Actinokineospora iranica]|uniref:Uncharacterized protein n=1 Tax=Actinokineospora iranica TaxID=1271860 RepID=A0A1G6JX46_9PSEU|nr:hypothetical protein [Actinokineospora iranica]SDC23191.1 hypothetical protein SAMN05216174_101600 [Actinokineospora iranica]